MSLTSKISIINFGLYGRHTPVIIMVNVTKLMISGVNHALCVGGGRVGCYWAIIVQ